MGTAGSGGEAGRCLLRLVHRLAVHPRRLDLQTVELRGRYRQRILGEDHEVRPHPGRQPADLLFVEARIRRVRGEAAQRLRSEEHTSELQSLMRISYAVFCLKKKK